MRDGAKSRLILGAMKMVQGLRNVFDSEQGIGLGIFLFSFLVFRRGLKGRFRFLF